MATSGFLFGFFGLPCAKAGIAAPKPNISRRATDRDLRDPAVVRPLQPNPPTNATPRQSPPRSHERATNQRAPSPRARPIRTHQNARLDATTPLSTANPLLPPPPPSFPGTSPTHQTSHPRLTHAPGGAGNPPGLPGSAPGKAPGPTTPGGPFESASPSIGGGGGNRPAPPRATAPGRGGAAGGASFPAAPGSGGAIGGAAGRTRKGRGHGGRDDQQAFAWRGGEGVRRVGHARAERAHAVRAQPRQTTHVGFLEACARRGRGSFPARRDGAKHHRASVYHRSPHERHPSA